VEIERHTITRRHESKQMTGLHDTLDKRNKGKGRAEMVSSLFL